MFREREFVYICSVVFNSLQPHAYSLPGSSVHGIFQVRIMEWFAISSSRGSSWPRDWTHVSWVSCCVGGFFTCWAIIITESMNPKTSYSLEASFEWDQNLNAWRSQSWVHVLSLHLAPCGTRKNFPGWMWVIKFISPSCVSGFSSISKTVLNKELWHLNS